MREPPFLAISVDLRHQPDWSACGIQCASERIGALARDLDVRAGHRATAMFVFTILLATLYGGELVWRERQIKADQLQDATPVPAWVTFGGKLLAVFLAIMVLVFVATVGAEC